LIQLLEHHQVETLVMQYGLVHCVEEVGSAGGSVGEVGACDLRVEKDEVGTEVDTYTERLPLGHQEEDDVVLVGVGEAEVGSKLLLLVNVGMAGGQGGGDHMAVEDDAKM
jgi:hypothetical protein